MESESSPIEAKVTLSPNLSKEQTKKSKLTITYIGLEAYKYNSRKRIVDFGNAISCRISWKHEVVWFTDDDAVTIWKASGNRS